MSVQKNYALILGIVLLLIGIVGFFPNALVSNQAGAFFGVNPAQNILHLIAGVIGIYIGIKGKGPTYNMILGWIGVALGILGFIPGISDFLLSLLNITSSTSVLHIAIGVISLGVYYGASKK